MSFFCFVLKVKSSEILSHFLCQKSAETIWFFIEEYKMGDQLLLWIYFYNFNFKCTLFSKNVLIYHWTQLQTWGHANLDIGGEKCYLKISTIIDLPRVRILSRKAVPYLKIKTAEYKLPRNCVCVYLSFWFPSLGWVFFY